MGDSGLSHEFGRAVGHRLAPALKPGAWVMRLLPVWAKLALVTVVLFAPMSLSLVAVVSNAQVTRQVTHEELAGLPAVTAIDHLLIALSRCSHDSLVGRPDRDISPFTTAVSRSLAAAELSPEIGTSWAAVRDRLLAAGPRARPGCAEQTTASTDMSTLVDITARVADDSQLMLDPGHRTYNLQLGLTSHLPRLIAGLAEVEQSLADRPDRPLLTDGGQIEASVLVVDVARRLEQSVAQAVEEGREPADLDLLATASSLRAWAEVRADAIHAVGHGRALQAEAGASTGNALDGLRQAERLVAGMSKQLERVLSQRLDDQRNSWIPPVVWAAVAVALVLYLLLAMGWSMSRDLRRVHRGLARTLQGVPDPPQLQQQSHLLPRGDELAAVAVAVDAMQGQIQSLLIDLRTSSSRHESLMRQSSDITVVTDERGRLLYVSPSLDHVLGHSSQDWVGCRLSDLVHEDDRSSVERALEDLLAGRVVGEVDARFSHADGGMRRIGARCRDARGDESVAGVLWNLRDTTEAQALAEQLRHRAFHDELTGLANRALFVDRLQQALARASRSRQAVSVCILDLDGFKAVNDNHGHQAGDDLLRAVSARFRSAVRPADTVARLGGDEFGVLIEDASPEEAMLVAQRLAGSLLDPLRIAGVGVTASTSIGLTSVSGRECTADQVMDEADTAMYRAKTSGRGLVREFELSMLRTDPRAVAYEVAELLADPDGMTVVFQPICELSNGKVVGYEALTRFPGREHRSVEDWFRAARDCGRGPELDAATLRNALGAPRPPDGTYLGVNVSPVSLMGHDVQQALGGDLHGVLVEITEDTELEVEVLKAAVQPLRDRGARIAVDDTGAGYANLKQLVQLRPDVVKLDRELVTGVHIHPEKRALVEALVSFCLHTDADLCAEGIETVDELVTLVDVGVTHGQGWFLGRAAETFTGPEFDAVAAITGLPRVNERIDPEPVLSRIAASPQVFDVAGALRGLANLTDVDDVALSLIAGEELRIVTQHAWTTSEDVFLLADYPASQLTLNTASPVSIRVDDPSADPAEVRLLREIGFGTLLMVPVVEGADQLALIEWFCVATRDWSAAELRLARDIAEATREVLVRFRKSDPVPAMPQI